MENLDALFPNVKTIKIGERIFKIAPLGPYLMGQIIDYIKDKKRSEIVKTAMQIGNVSLAELNKTIKEELADISPKALDIAMGDEDVMTHFIFYDLQIYQPELIYSDMGKLLNLENIHEIIGKIFGDETANFQKANPKMVELKSDGQQ